jgi:uncharacterized protein (UPF0179 family)
MIYVIVDVQKRVYWCPVGDTRCVRLDVVDNMKFEPFKVLVVLQNNEAAEGLII